jgi:hypothetical protein
MIAISTYNLSIIPLKELQMRPFFLFSFLFCSLVTLAGTAFAMNYMMGDLWYNNLKEPYILLFMGMLLINIAGLGRRIVAVKSK